MKSKRIISIAAALLLLIGVCSAAASGGAGSSSDPLATRSYATGTFSSNILAKARDLISQKLSGIAGTGTGGSGTTGNYQIKSLGSGSVVTLLPGGSAVLLSGGAELSVYGGTVINTTAGTAVEKGAMGINNRYLSAEDTTALITVSKSSLIALDGAYTVENGSGKASPFLDVGEDDWFFSDVLNAISMGFIKGKTSTIFDPGNNLTYAETITLASSIHQKYYYGSITLSNGDPWYQPYVDYARTNGLITEDYADYNAYITRGEFVSIFYRTMPRSQYTAINSAEDGSIPDVSMADKYSTEIYTFYRAGIVTGYEDGAFRPERNIERSEIATLISRMFDVSARKVLG